MIFDWPDYLITKSLDVDSQKAIVSSEARNKVIYTRELGGQRFDVRLRIDVAPWNAKKASGFLFALQSDDTYFRYSDIEWHGGTNTTVVGAHATGEKEIEIADTSEVNFGDWLNFGGHTKLYRVKAIVGDVITIHTELIQPLSNGETVIFDEPTGVFELSPEMKRSANFSGKLSRDLSRCNIIGVEYL